MASLGKCPGAQTTSGESHRESIRDDVQSKSEVVSCRLSTPLSFHILMTAYRPLISPDSFIASERAKMLFVVHRVIDGGPCKLRKLRARTRGFTITKDPTSIGQSSVYSNVFFPN